MADELEKNSRTIREARRGQIETLVLIVPLVLSIITASADANLWVRIPLIGFALCVVVVTFPRWGRIRRYRRQDHQENLNRKPQDA